MGVLAFFGRLICSNLGPLNHAFFDFSNLCMELLTNAYGDLQVLTFGLGPLATWQASTYACMVDFRWGAAWKHIKKNNIEEVGDLGIEPRSQYLRATSITNWTNARICYLDN